MALYLKEAASSLRVAYGNSKLTPVSDIPHQVRLSKDNSFLSSVEGG